MNNLGLNNDASDNENDEMEQEVGTINYNLCV